MEFRFFSNRLINGDFQDFRNQLGKLVDLPEWNIKDPAHIADHGAGLQLAECNNLGNMVRAAVFRKHILKHQIALIHTEINVNIRHALAPWIEEPLKDEPVLNRIEFRDPQRICHQTSCGRSTARSHRDTRFPGITYEISNHKKVPRKPHLPDYVNLVFEAIPVSLFINSFLTSLTYFPESLLQTFFGVQGHSFRCGLAGSYGESREMILSEFKFHVALPGNMHRVFYGFREIRKIPFHFPWRLEIKLIGLKFQPFLIVNSLAGLDTQKDVVCADVFTLEIMTIVCGHKGD